MASRRKRATHRERWSARAHPRNARGRFVRKSSSRRRNPGKGRHVRHRYHRERWSASEHPRGARGQFVRKNPRSRSHHRRSNPGLPRDIVGRIGRGALDALEIVAGKAVTKGLPSLVKAPTTGNTGLAVQGLAAVVVGLVADMVGGAEIGRMVLAGGLSAPIESIIAGAGIPYLSPALNGTLSSYVMPPAQLPVQASRGRGRALLSSYSGGVPAYMM